MPSELRRPPLPDLSEWTSRIEDELVGRVRPARTARTTPRALEHMLRFFRSIARPAGHGIAAFAASLVVITSLSVPGPVEQSSVPTDVPPPVLAERAPAPVETDGFLTLLPPDDAQAVRISDIETARGALTEAPQSDAPAVPTPEGGGWTEATLRPTVR
jgi:hypothetical protein